MTRRQKKLRFSKWLRSVFVSQSRTESLRAGVQREAGLKRRILVEPLEQRQLLAGDLFSALLGSSYGDSQDSGNAAGQDTTGGMAGSLQGEGELVGEGEPAPDLVAFAKALTDSGTLFFGAAWCPFCTDQKELFEDGGKYLPFIEVTDANQDPNQIAIDEGISEFPTWEFPDGTRLTGVQSLETLSQRSGVSIPQSETPSFDDLEDVTVRIGSPLHIPIDAYDPNGDPLTITVSSSDSNVVAAEVLQGNRSLRLDVAGYGDMVFELFENRAPRPSGRVIELAEDGFYDGVTFHRVIDNFVIQGGDPTGTGAGGSTLGDFDDQFHLDLQHNRTGVLSYAKSTDDTNDSQFFITEGPQRFLDFNHSVFGQLVEGEDNREAISNIATNASDRPINTVTIESASIFQDNENGIVVLRGNQAGTATVTVTVTDSDGNSTSQSFEATVAQDTANGTPFLNPIAPVETDVNTPVTLTLTAQDKEDDTFVYSVQPEGNVTFGLDVNSATGEVTVTPPTDFVGELQFTATVRQSESSTTSSKNDNQLVTVQVVGAEVEAPTSVDLLAGSDSGTSDTDNITNAGSLTFSVGGTTTGATVEIRNGNQVVGSATATGSTTEVTVSDAAALGEGSFLFTATQTIDGTTSEESSGLNVVLDRTAPGQIGSGVIPVSATVDDPIAVNLELPEEGQGLVYSLANAPTGMSLDSSTGQLAWTPTPGQVGSQTFSIALTDAAGNTTSQEFTLDVIEDPLVAIGLNIVDANGQPLSTIGVGETFRVQVTVEDLRGFAASGVFGAYVDLLYDSAIIEPVASNAITHVNPYVNGIDGSTSSQGIVDELGGFSSSTSPLGSGVRILAEVEFTALATGNAGLIASAADDSGNDVLLYDVDLAIPLDRVQFSASSFAVGLDFELADDTFNFDEDSGEQSLDVLDNDTTEGNAVLTIVDVSTPGSGGQVSIAADGLSINYTPPQNFNGVETFVYTVENQSGLQSEATVTVQVADVNDPPVALNDSFSVTENSSNNILDVLANDNSGVDDANSETLSVDDVDTDSISGTVSVASNGTLRYTPASGFTGSETFTYTLSDGRGGTATGSVTVNVDVENPPPVAQDDSFDVDEDDPQASFDVLANDSTDDPDETLSIAKVSSSSRGSSVQVSADGGSILYRPAANFNGTEVLTYTLQDSGGATATAQVTFSVASVNDAPVATNDAATAISGQDNTTIEVLENDEDVDGDDLEITEVTQPASGRGSVAISGDGKSLIYSPPNDDFEGSVSFTYTISDGNGGSDTATVQIDVADYIPRSINGNVFADGTFDDLLFANFAVSLEGTDFAGNSLTRSAMVTNGTFAFDELAPGQYTLIREALPFLHDSGEQITINSELNDGDVVQELRVTGSLRPQFFGIRDFLGSSFGDNLLLAMHEDGSTAWSMAKGAWTELSTLDINVDQDETLNVSAVNGDSETISGDLPLNDSSTRAYQPGRQSPYRLLRIPGTPEDAGVVAPSDDGNGEGEGEGIQASPAETSPLVGEGEAFPSPLSPRPADDAATQNSIAERASQPASRVPSNRAIETGSGQRNTSTQPSNSTLGSFRRSLLASHSGSSNGLSSEAVDQAMTSLLPKLQIGLSEQLENSLTADSESSFELHDRILSEL